MYTLHITVLGYRLDNRGSIPDRCKVSRKEMGPIHSPAEWVLGAVPRGINWSGREADHAPPSSAEVKNVWSYNSNSSYDFMVCTGKIYLFTVRNEF